VLNNATAAGQSQLAGALAANPQFQGQAASTILNEVVSRNASLIEGPQEIFGRPADYILANPNGITLNGGSFINTTRAGFVVGTPAIRGATAQVPRYAHGQWHLQVLEHGQSNAGGALELIAPRVDSKGLLMASETLDITVGRNRIDSRSGEVVEHLPSPSSSIDASLFGAMRAGRIRVSTAEGAVCVWGLADSGRRGGRHQLGRGPACQGSGDRPTELRSERGVLKLTAADDLMLETVDGQAPRIEARAGKKLTLDAKTIEHIKHDSDSWNKKFWFVTRETYNSKTTTTHQQQQGSQLLGTDSVLLQSGDDMRMTAAKVDAGSELMVDSGAGLDILAGIDSKRTEQQVRHRKDLWRGDSDSDQLKETAKAVP
jgi:hemolysin